MTGFFQKISFRIWFPFALTLSLMMLIVAFYYPREQEKLFRSNKERELRELAKTVALGVELSLRADDFQGLKKTIDFVSGTSDFEFVSIIVEDSITGKENVFISYPEKPQEEILALNPDLYVYQKYPFRTADFVGNILISASKEKINELVFNLNKPVYIVLPIILVVSLLFFFILASRISRPILQLTRAAKELEAENYAVVIPVVKQQTKKMQKKRTDNFSKFAEKKKGSAIKESYRQEKRKVKADARAAGEEMRALKKAKARGEAIEPKKVEDKRVVGKNPERKKTPYQQKDFKKGPKKDTGVKNKFREGSEKVLDNETQDRDSLIPLNKFIAHAGVCGRREAAAQ